VGTTPNYEKRSEKGRNEDENTNNNQVETLIIITVRASEGE
jgi:hypothetical protein